ncbi:MAG: TetR/AcrR family transcriptional regulator, partial [Cupriavidus necator]
MSNHSTQRAPTHKDRLLKEGFKQFYAHGFGGTSLETVLVEAGVPKGSFYHHFGSKESFAV